MGYLDVHSAGVAGTPPQPVPAPYPIGDARAVPRQQTMFVVGRIVTADRECICLVRNISTAGAGIDHCGPLPIDSEVDIETRTMLPTRAIVRWSNDTAAGLEFLEPPRVLWGAEPTTPRPACTLRSPRFALDSDADLLIGDTCLHARTCDIALGGVKLTGLDAAPPTLMARVGLRELGRIMPGRIRWARASSIGFQFVTPLSSQDLAALLDVNLRPRS